jgi:hypothetical protein
VLQDVKLLIDIRYGTWISYYVRAEEIITSESARTFVLVSESVSVVGMRLSPINLSRFWPWTDPIPVLQIRITLIQIRILLDSACHFDEDPDLDPACQINADPDPDSIFQIKAQNL